MQVTFEDNWVYVQTNDPAQNRMLELYHNAATSKKGWRLPKTVWVLRELVKGFPQLKDNHQVIAEGQNLRFEMDAHVRKRSFTDLIFPVEHPLYPLRQYQRNDVMVLTETLSAGVFNEPRTGKTPTVIATLRELGKKRNLIVTPASLTLNWIAELGKWWPGAEVFLADKNRKKTYEAFRACKGCAVFVMSRDRLKADLNQWNLAMRTFDTCVVDEAHFLRNYKTAQSKALFLIKAERRYALTGTPTVKHPSDVWGILHFLNPKQFPSFWQFAERYFDIGKDFMGHNVIGDVKSHREKELQEMIGLMSVQRKRKEVMPWLPAKQRSTFLSTMEGKQQKLYDEMVKFFSASDGELEVDTSSVITQLMRLRQLCLDPRLLGFDVPGAKTQALLEFLEDRPKEPVVIMSWFTSYLKLLKPMLEKLGRKVAMIHGECTANAKAAAAGGFQAGTYDTLLCNIVSAGVGFTLDRSQTVLFLDRAWNPAENEQAEDRVCPTDESRNHKHEIIDFVCKNSVEERILELLNKKKSLTDVINEGGARAVKNLLLGVK